ncbi:MAG: hypothetical protein ACR2J1_08510 [Methyloceanibacter sp.]|uniref:hypothetical protein n=1 Tax=Methyloceanibacter sp. TaxID=1965321 RepID=UPI003D9AD774
MTVDFRSMLGLLGNLFAGWRRVPKHMQPQGKAVGWFRRGMGGYLILKELEHQRRPAPRQAVLLAGAAVADRHCRVVLLTRV